VKQTDEQLLDAIAVLYAHLDPAPDDLADGVLARLAVEGLESEYELLTLVERVDHSAGTRGGPEVASAEDEATVALEFAGTSYRVLVRISTVDGHRRLDGWVVPAVPMKIFLGPPGDALAQTRQSAESDEDGRFEFSAPPTGEARLWLLPQSSDRSDDSSAAAPPFVTPPFLI
jgi:hypothetical protein